MSKDEILERLGGHQSSTIHEAAGRVGAIGCGIQALDRDMRACGRAVTVRCHGGDNLSIFPAMQKAGPGDILVVDASKATDYAYFGELMATQCIRQGIAGLVIAGCVRDSAEIIKLGFPVFAVGRSIRGTVKETLGVVNGPIVCAGETVRPGDIVVGDCDGVVVIPYEKAGQVLKASDERVEWEKQIRTRVLSGESMCDIFNFGPKLEALDKILSH